MTRNQKQADALQVLTACGVSLGDDFHALSSKQVDALLTYAALRHYRKPRNANGSRARYFHAFMVRLASHREEWRLWINYGQGWEHETSEESNSEIRARCREYRENCPQYARKVTGPHRVPVEQGEG